MASVRGQLGSWAYVFAWAKRIKLCERFIHNELLMGSSHQPDDRTRQQETKLPPSTPQIEEAVDRSSY